MTNMYLKIYIILVNYTSVYFLVTSFHLLFILILKNIKFRTDLIFLVSQQFDKLKQHDVNKL